jgi:hypothetical protein
MKRYEVNGWLASYNVDDYEQGEQDEGYSIGGEERWHADTLPALIEQIMAFAGTDDAEAVAIFEEEDGRGRIDIQTLEDIAYDRHLTPTEADIEAWKRGEKKLYASYYIFIVERVERGQMTYDELCAALPDTARV